LKTDTGILQDDVRKHLKCGEMFDKQFIGNHFIADLLVSVAVKEFLQICQYLVEFTKKNRRLTFWITQYVFFLAHPVVL